eukprot:4063157-Pyramimonas_sp.AAC.1
MLLLLLAAVAGSVVRLWRPGAPGLAFALARASGRPLSDGGALAQIPFALLTDEDSTVLKYRNA